MNEENEILQTNEEQNTDTLEIKEEKPKKEKKAHKKLKHGSMAVAFTAVFIAVLVLINIVATQVFERFPLSFDMTSNA